MKIALYVSKFNSDNIQQSSLNIGYISSYCKKHLNDINFLLSNDCNEILNFYPEILGISCVSMVVNDAIRAAKLAKENNKDIINIIGGYHVSMFKKTPIYFDIGVIGEGEKTFCELVENIKRDKNIQNWIKNINGIVYKDFQDTNRELIKNIDEIPFPDRRIFNNTSNFYIFSSRGCPYHCMFCASSKMWDIVRYHSSDYFVSEVEYLIEKYNAKGIYILDDLFIGNKKRFLEISDNINKLGINKKVYFHGFVRANLIDEDIIKNIKLMNFSYIRFGIETGSEKLLKIIKNNTVSIKDYEIALDLCRKYNVQSCGSFMFGFPGETEEDIKLTFDFINKNKDIFNINGFYLTTPIPGTVLWDKMIEKNVINENIDFNSLRLDIRRKEFNWDKIIYCNNDILPLKKFKNIIINFINKYLK